MPIEAIKKMLNDILVYQEPMGVTGEDAVESIVIKEVARDYGILL